MSDPRERPWSNNPNAPKIPYNRYFVEKAYLAGSLIASILYGTRKAPRPHVRPSLLTLFVLLIPGVLIVLFFQCMTALFNPANRRRKGVKWGLASYTVLMFSFATVLTGMQLHTQSISFIDNRSFPGLGGLVPPGPLGYQAFIWSGPLLLAPNLVFILSNWLAHGLLVSPLFAAGSLVQASDADSSSSSIVVTWSTP